MLELSMFSFIYKLQLIGLVFLVGFMACNESQTNPSSNSLSGDEQDIKDIEQITYYSDIKPILDAYCVDCHQADGIAPFPLEEFSILQPYVDLIVHSITQKTMPPWGANDVGVPLKYDQRLSADQISMITQWVEDGAIEGDPDDTLAPIYVDKGGLERVDLTLSLPSTYIPNRDRLDDYRCFVLPWPLDEDNHIVGFSGVPGNQKSVHHLVAFKIGPNQAELVDGFEALDDGPGYTCYGDANPSNWEPESLADTLVYSFVGQWAPGQEGSVFPSSSGQKVESGSRIILQVHYSTVAEGDLADQSSIQFMLDQEVQNEGIYLPWFDITWYLQPDSMLIPAGQDHVRHVFTNRLGASPGARYIAGDMDLSQGAYLHAIFPHMHTLGRQFNIRHISSEGQIRPILQIPDYDFNWQREYHLQEPVYIAPDDEIELECIWDNTMEQILKSGLTIEELQDVSWGDGTYDEMCIAMMYLTPTSMTENK